MRSGSYILPLVFCLLTVAFMPAAATASPTVSFFKGVITLREVAPGTCPANVIQQASAFYLHRKGSRVVIEYVDGTILQGLWRENSLYASGQRDDQTKDTIRIKGLEGRSARVRVKVLWNKGQECSYTYLGTVRRSISPN